MGNNRANPQANTTRRQGGIPPQRRLGTQNAFAGQQPVRKPIGDARNRIIQKKRLHLTDARDKLCELAKQTDARQKLEKLRERRMVRPPLQVLQLLYYQLAFFSSNSLFFLYFWC